MRQIPVTIDSRLDAPIGYAAVSGNGGLVIELFQGQELPTQVLVERLFVGGFEILESIETRPGSNEFAVKAMRITHFSVESKR